MARWVRDGDAPDKVPVSFVVTKADHPELVEWLWTLPFRKQSEVIRNILSEAAKIVSAEDKPARAPVTGEPRPKVAPSKGPSPAKPAPADRNPQAGSSSSMTAATAEILRRQQEDF